MERSRLASWSPWPLVLAVAALLATGGAHGQTTWTKDEGNPVLAPGAPGEWDQGGVVSGAVLFDGTTYHLWYAGVRTQWPDVDVGHATSPDGITWTKHPEPVLRTGTGWDGTTVDNPFVAFDGSVYRMWYTGFGNVVRIGHAVSADGIHWARQPAREAVFQPGGAGAWDSGGVDVAQVVLVGDEAQLWYTGWVGDLESIAIGRAAAPLPFPDPPLLLQGGRFLVESLWWTADGRVGDGDPFPLTDDSGAFTFFDPANIELLVKVLDGCSINQRTWVFAAGLTDVGVGLTVTDTETGDSTTYNSAAGVPFAPILDTDAFALCE